MSHVCITRSVGYATAHAIHKPGHALFGWSRPVNAGLKPDSFERASILLDGYSTAVESGVIENEFTPDVNHPRYGLSDNYFWISRWYKGEEIWGLVRTPIKDGDIFFIEGKIKNTK